MGINVRLVLAAFMLLVYGKKIHEKPDAENQEDPWSFIGGYDEEFDPEKNHCIKLSSASEKCKSELESCRQTLLEQTVYNSEGSAFKHLFKTLSKLFIKHPKYEKKVLFRGEMALLDYELLERTLKEENVRSKLLLDLFKVQPSESILKTVDGKRLEDDVVDGFNRKSIKAWPFEASDHFHRPLFTHLILSKESGFHSSKDMLYGNFWNGIVLLFHGCVYYSAVLKSILISSEIDISTYQFHHYAFKYDVDMFTKIVIWLYFCGGTVYLLFYVDVKDAFKEFAKALKKKSVSKNLFQFISGTLFACLIAVIVVAGLLLFLPVLIIYGILNKK